MSDYILFALTALASIQWSNHQAANKKWRSNENHISSTESLVPRQAIQEGKTLDQTEWIQIVNESNEPTGKATRRDMRLQNLWHRATYVLVFWDNNEDDDLSSKVVLVQRRSLQKDYCPGKLDATPGGVVEFEESYRDNAKRELEEEMGIEVEDEKLQRLFTFSFSNDVVRVWGELFTYHYSSPGKKLHDAICVDESEVQEVLPMTLEELETAVQSSSKSGKANSTDFMPDCLYCLQLYFQYLHNHVRLKRRLLRGFSSHDENYNLRPPIRALLFDCDDCLYFNQWTLAKQITDNMDQVCGEKYGFQPGEARQLCLKHGTTLRGLINEGYMTAKGSTTASNAEIEAFLERVHNIPIHDFIQPDAKLRQMLLNVDPNIPKFVFTASIKEHAQRCLKALGIEENMFVDIFDIRATRLESKHSPRAFQYVMEAIREKLGANVMPESCVFLDDSLGNIKTARHFGWRSILVGKISRDSKKAISSPHAENQIHAIHDLPKVLPEAFPNISS